MNANFLIALREGLEVSLVIGFLLISLIQSKKQQLIKSVLTGTAFGVVISILAGISLFITVGELEGRVEEIVEGSIQLIAAMLIFYFVFWLSNQNSSNISNKLKSELTIKDSSASLFFMATIFVVREGLELVLFSLSNAETIGVSGAISMILGIIAAIAIAYIFIRSTINLNIKVIFTLLGVLLVFFGGHVFTEGLLTFFDGNSIIEHVAFYGFIIISLIILFKNNLLSLFQKFK